MIVNLSEAEVKIIQGWYNASAEESYCDISATARALIEKLGLILHPSDEYARRKAGLL